MVTGRSSELAISDIGICVIGMEPDYNDIIGL